MSREIKFRAWDADPALEEPEMYDWAKLNKLDSEGLVHLFDILIGNEKHITPMQYTGLKDKNGIDVYEGDIVGEHGDPNCFLIVWDEYCASFGYKLQNNGNTKIGELTGDFLEETTIIGNLYTTPELLNQQQ